MDEILTMDDLTTEMRRIAAKIGAGDRLNATERKFAKNTILKYADVRDSRASGRTGKHKFSDEYHRLHREKTLSDRVIREFKELREEPIK